MNSNAFISPLGTQSAISGEWHTDTTGRAPTNLVNYARMAETSGNLNTRISQVYATTANTAKTGAMIAVTIASSISTLSGILSSRINSIPLPAPTPSSQALVKAPTPVIVNVIDVTKSLNTDTVNDDKSYVFNGDPAIGHTFFSLYVTNVDSNDHQLSIPPSFSMSQHAMIDHVPIVANGRVMLTWQYDGGSYCVYGDV